MAIPTLDLEDIILTTVVGSVNGQTVINTLHWRVDTTADGIEVNSAMMSLNTQLAAPGNFTADYLTCAPNNYNMRTLRSQRINPVRTAIVETVVDGNGVMSQSNAQNICAVITKRTLLSGRNQVGSIHIPLSSAPTEITGGLLTVAQQTALNDFKSNLYTTLALVADTLDFTLVPVLYHGTGSDPTYTDIQSALVQGQVRVMRRRTVGLGI